jgi:hypothetical protein
MAVLRRKPTEIQIDLSEDDLMKKLNTNKITNNKKYWLD